MRILFNVLWHFPGLGFISALLAFLLGAILCATMVLAPAGVGVLEYGKFLLAPCTRQMVRKTHVAGSTRTLWWWAWSAVIWVVYLPLGVVLSVLVILETAALIVWAIPTIIGIPVAAFQAYIIAKSLGTLLNPVGKKCVHHLVADEAARETAREKLQAMRG